MGDIWHWEGGRIFPITATVNYYISRMRIAGSVLLGAVLSVHTPFLCHHGPVPHIQLAAFALGGRSPKRRRGAVSRAKDPQHPNPCP